jgi:hypothetical protein
MPRPSQSARGLFASLWVSSASALRRFRSRSRLSKTRFGHHCFNAILLIYSHESFHSEVGRFLGDSSNTRLSSRTRLISLFGSISLRARSASSLQSPDLSALYVFLLSSMCFCAGTYVSHLALQKAQHLPFSKDQSCSENELHTSAAGLPLACRASCEELAAAHERPSSSPRLNWLIRSAAQKKAAIQSPYSSSSS